MTKQPFLHDLLAALGAPTQAWSGSDNQIRHDGAQGIFHGDLRALARAELTIDGEEPEAIRTGTGAAGVVWSIAVARMIDTDHPDPTVRVERERVCRPGTVTERIVLTNAAARTVAGQVRITLGSDLALMSDLKEGRTAALVPATVEFGNVISWSGEGLGVTVQSDAEVVMDDVTAPALVWDVDLETDQTTALEWSITLTDHAGVVTSSAEGDRAWRQVNVESSDIRLPALLEQSLHDLRSLVMSSQAAPEHTFVAAGAPWFFTLFGRDSIWAARMLLPLGTELAAGTLRTLAAFQGTTVDNATAEEPGKIVHELRRHDQRLGGEVTLPPTYYGTIDATPLWICLLHDAWRWGMDRATVESLAPNLQAALDWMAHYGDADGDGLLEYIDRSGRGLANQGWKDSHDSIQWKSGALADAPIALCEVQGYAYEAAIKGAALLDELRLPGAQRWRTWASGLAERFRATFWVDNDDGQYPAIALDRAKRPVDSIASNMGHLLGTGMLTETEEQLVVHQLMSPAMLSGFGLRTLAESSSGYWPLRYHGGTVWPHDTAIVIQGLSRSGFAKAAARLAESLLAAAPSFEYRFPELFAGDSSESFPDVVPYPAACRPQAWSAAAAVAVISTLLGLDADVPDGTVTVRPVLAHAGHMRIRGLRLVGQELSIATEPGRLPVVTTTAEVTVEAALPEIATDSMGL